MDTFSANVVALPQEHIVRLADEGVPIAAIARGMRTTFDQVRGVLCDALTRGQIAELPANDWPPHGSRNGRTPAISVLSANDYEHCITWLCLRYALSPQEARMLYALTSPRFLTKESLHIAISEAPYPISDPTLVITVVCKLRQKLRQQGVLVNIETIWGRGYYIQPDARRRLRAKIVAGAAAYVAGQFKKAG